jgi:anhydro-N-acetylmuramic acid kinase
MLFRSGREQMKHSKKTYNAIGIMSGTSLDGLDIVFARFTYQKRWSYEILAAKTYPYSRDWYDKLSKAPLLSAIELELLDIQYGQWLGKKVLEFVVSHSIEPDFVASHGHTVFHQPELGVSKQIGDGQALSQACGLKVIYNFRTCDMLLGGQGAPLVPIGDQLLFGKYSACVNLGGFANVSYENNGKRLAFDICPANIVLNFLSRKTGMKYDKNGDIASRGKVNQELLSKLNAISYYHLPPPKSLGREWVQASIIPLLEHAPISIEDKISTFTEHISISIHKSLQTVRGEVLFTGGGVYNSFLIKKISKKIKTIIPDNQLIEYKEALIFAFLGVLKFEKKINTLSSVTGAKRDSSGGILIDCESRSQ